MTDNELKELVAGLATSNAENAKMFEETKILFKQTDKQFKQTDKKMLETDRMIQENAAELRKTEEILKNLGIHIGGMANSNGYSTEEYFFNSLEDDKRLGTLKFDEISRNLHYKLPNLEDEFDITMFNGKNVALIECKYNAKEDDVVKLMEKKVSNFKQLFPFYANHNFYLGIASFSFDKRVETFAKENGVAILKQKGGVVEIVANKLKVY